MTSQYRCKSCARSKVRCSRSLPCERCFATCGPKCEPPDALRRRYGSNLELVFSLLDKPGIKDSLHQALVSMRQDGRLNTGMLMEELGAWSAMSERVGADMTHGALGSVTGALGLADIKPEASPAEPPAILHLESSSSYSALVDSPLPVFILHTARGGSVVLSNHAASEKFVSSVEINDAAATHGLLPIMALAGLVAPEDRELWFEAALFGLAPVSPVYTTFVKVASRELEVELYILRSTCASLEGAGGRTTVLTLETVPTSKHITRRPGHRHKLLDVFRQRRPQGETSSSSSGVRIPPPITCLPMPPLADSDVRDLLGEPPSSSGSGAAGSSRRSAGPPAACSITWPPVPRPLPPPTPTAAPGDPPDEALAAPSTASSSFSSPPSVSPPPGSVHGLQHHQHQQPQPAQERMLPPVPMEPSMEWLQGVVGPDGYIVAPEHAGSMAGLEQPAAEGEAGEPDRGFARVFSPSDADILMTLLNSPSLAQSSGSSGDADGSGT